MSTMRLYVEIESAYPNNPIQLAIGKIGESAGASIVERLVSDDEVEADIAVTNSAAKALSILKETERTIIVVAHFSRDERETAEALAGNHPKRVKAVPYVVQEEDGVELVPFLLAMLAQSDAAKDLS